MINFVSMYVCPNHGLPEIGLGNATIKELRSTQKCALCEITELRIALEILRNCTLRMCCHINNPNKQTVSEVVHVKREDWDKAFAPLSVTPYNRLRWEKTE